MEVAKKVWKRCRWCHTMQTKKPLTENGLCQGLCESRWAEYVKHYRPEGEAP